MGLRHKDPASRPTRADLHDAPCLRVQNVSCWPTLRGNWQTACYWNEYRVLH